MELLSEWVNYASPAGAVRAYLTRARAASSPLPGVIVIQEVWGADRHITDVADRFASAGYVALAPDLYSAGGGGRLYSQPSVWKRPRRSSIRSHRDSG